MFNINRNDENQRLLHYSKTGACREKQRAEDETKLSYTREEILNLDTNESVETSYSTRVVGITKDMAENLGNHNNSPSLPSISSPSSNAASISAAAASARRCTSFNPLSSST